MRMNPYCAKADPQHKAQMKSMCEEPLIAQRLPLEEARRAHEMLGEGGVLDQDRAAAEQLAKHGFRSPLK
jgi:hypothetical protein